MDEDHSLRSEMHKYSKNSQKSPVWPSLARKLGRSSTLQPGSWSTHFGIRSMPDWRKPPSPPLRAPSPLGLHDDGVQHGVPAKSIPLRSISCPLVPQPPPRIPSPVGDFTKSSVVHSDAFHTTKNGTAPPLRPPVKVRTSASDAVGALQGESQTLTLFKLNFHGIREQRSNPCGSCRKLIVKSSNCS